MISVRKFVGPALSVLALAAAAGTARAQLKVGFSQEGAESGWRAANTASIKQAADDAGVQLKFTDSQGKVQDQIKALDTFLQQRLDVVALSPKEESGWDPILKRLKRAHIPVICSDRNVKVSDPSLQPTFIGSDFVAEGHRAGDWLVKKTGGKADVVILLGSLGSTPELDRLSGFMDAVKGSPDVKVLVQREGKFERGLGKQVMEAVLKSPEGAGVTAVYAENDDMALGAIQALEEAGKKPGSDVVVVSVDGIKDALQAIVDGKLNCTIECNPLLGPAIMEAAKKLKAGDTLPARIISKEELFDDPAKVKEIINGRKY